MNNYGFPNCRACQCNEHSSSCDPVSGVCTNCKDNTGGPSCNLCADGYYGDATAGNAQNIYLKGFCERCFKYSDTAFLRITECFTQYFKGNKWIINSKPEVL